ncbi:response regulator transcription factor [Bifidobacterium tsurumiense]|uniref:Response regulator of two-component system n=1 Tax=Bifidobacterium tsurumiense TaxID=356829 RepID=A0A087EKV2_9BIFI|nr:response regulator transcription factor [Bifidobacterium tsurumiense]KFJ08403.1 response regulator of two-component system [Bifidobacterium tsurumiense]MDY4678404.1 response regulator transcription factor [Bifidobacterium tsurumiense]MSS12627.1 response regulator transcription factor [Bifidobacterium tsurumiense]
MGSGQGISGFKVGILDNDELTLMVLSHCLETSLPATVWCATLGSKAIAMCRDDATRPDILLADMSLNDMSGDSCIAEIRESGVRIPILAITSFPLHVYAALAAEAGAQGIVPKRSLAVIRSAVTTLLSGGIWASSIEDVEFHTADNALAHKMNPLTGDDKRRALSSREVEVITLFARGYTTEQISTELDVSMNTVKTYTNRIFDKLGAHTRSQAVALWLAEQ